MEDTNPSNKPPSNDRPSAASEPDPGRGSDSGPQTASKHWWNKIGGAVRTIPDKFLWPLGVAVIAAVIAAVIIGALKIGSDTNSAPSTTVAGGPGQRTVSSTTTSQPVYNVGFDKPPPGKTTPVHCSFYADENGTPSTGQDIVVTHRDQEEGPNADSRYYGAKATLNGSGKWQVKQVLGTPGSGRPKVGTTFALTLWLVDTWWVRSHPTFVRKTPPPGAKMKQTTQVILDGKC